LKTLKLTAQLEDEVVEQLKQNRVKMDATYYDLLVSGDESTEVITPDGRTLFKVIRAVIDPLTNDSAFDTFEKAYQRESAAYRGIAGGFDPDPHASSVSVGYLDRTARHGVKPCRETSFTLKNAALFGQAIPYIQAVDAVFRDHMPRQWFYQRFAASYANGWNIGDSCFSTVAVNQNFQTACHTDKGDLKGSFGVLTCFKRGDFSGGELIFPKYRVAVDFRDGDVLLANVHEVHGNTPIVPLGARHLRMSCVFYFRERIMQCGTPEQEEAFLNRRKTGDPLFGYVLERGEFVPDRN
jgi:hypothetical protein